MTAPAVDATDLYNVEGQESSGSVPHYHFDQAGRVIEGGPPHPPPEVGIGTNGSPAREGEPTEVWKKRQFEHALTLEGPNCSLVPQVPGPTDPPLGPTWKYNCVSAAFTDSLTFTGQPSDFSKCIHIGINRAPAILAARYEPLGPNESPQACNVVVYLDKKGVPQHMGHVYHVEGNNVTVRSKDGQGYYWSHNLFDNPLIKGYIGGPNGQIDEPSQVKVFKKKA